MPHEIIVLRPPFVAAAFVKEKKALVFTTERGMATRLRETPRNTMLPTRVGERKLSRYGTREGYVGTVELSGGRWVGDFSPAKGICDVPDGVITDVAEAFGYKRDTAPEPKPVPPTPLNTEEKKGIVSRVGDAIKGVFGGGHEPTPAPAAPPVAEPAPAPATSSGLMKIWMVAGQMYLVSMDVSNAVLDKAVEDFSGGDIADRNTFFLSRVGATPVAFHESKGG